jgi:F-type H+-transporting ATPase subunit delta
MDVLASPHAGVSFDEALQGLRAFRSLEDTSHELCTVLLSPAVSAKRKRVAVTRLADRIGLTRVLKNFIFVLIDHRRVALLGDVIEALESLIDERMGVVRASVSTARPLSGETRQEVEAALSRLTGKKVFGQYAVDDSLIGGIVARVGSRVYDGSVLGQLQAMRDRLVRS